MSGPSDNADQEALVPIEIEVRADQFDAIEEIVLSTGLSQSEIVRRWIDLGIASSRRQMADSDPQT